MQRQLGLAVFSIAALHLSACSEGDPDPRRFTPTDVTGAAGAGGSANEGGSGGAATGGAGGASNSGGNTSGGSAGSAGAGPVSFPPPGCTGCLELDVVIDPAFRDPAANNAQYLSSLYNFVFPATGVDMSNATVTWSVSTLTPGDQVYVTPFAQSGAPDYLGVFRPQTLLTAQNGFNASGTPFVDIVLDLANTAPAGVAATPAPSDAGAGVDAGSGPVLLDNAGMDKSAIYQMGLQIGALDTLTAPTTIRLLVDKVTITGVDPSNTMLRTREFTMGAEELTQNTYRVPAGSSGPKPY